MKVPSWYGTAAEPLPGQAGAVNWTVNDCPAAVPSKRSWPPLGQVMPLQQLACATASDLFVPPTALVPTSGYTSVSVVVLW